MAINFEDMIIEMYGVNRHGQCVKPEETKVEHLVCPCNSISDFPQKCPYHDKDYKSMPRVITSDNTRA